jgi:hypothetical protein
MEQNGGSTYTGLTDWAQIRSAAFFAGSRHAFKTATRTMFLSTLEL